MITSAMPIWIAMLRGINVGAHHRIKMEDLRSLFVSLKCEDPQTYVQSGNVIFRAKEKNEPQLTKKIADGIERKFGFRCEVVLRSIVEMQAAVKANPFAKRKDVEPGKLLVNFLAHEPGPGAPAAIAAFKDYPEELHLIGRELYIYFPDGAGKSKLPWAAVDKWLKTPGTARNWNSVTKMLAMAEEMEAA